MSLQCSAKAICQFAQASVSALAKGPFARHTLTEQPAVTPNARLGAACGELRAARRPLHPLLLAHGERMRNIQPLTA